MHASAYLTPVSIQRLTDRINQFISDTGIRLASKLIRISRYLPLVSFKYWLRGQVEGTESKLECWNIRYYFLSIYNQGGVRVTWKKHGGVRGRKSLKLLVVRSEILHISEREIWTRWHLLVVSKCENIQLNFYRSKLLFAGAERMEERVLRTYFTHSCRNYTNARSKVFQKDQIHIWFAN